MQLSSSHSGGLGFKGVRWALVEVNNAKELQLRKYNMVVSQQ